MLVDPEVLGGIYDTFGGFFARPDGVVDDAGRTWLGYGVFGSVHPGFRYELRRRDGDTFVGVELPHSVLFAAELFDRLAETDPRSLRPERGRRRAGLAMDR